MNHLALTKLHLWIISFFVNKYKSSPVSDDANESSCGQTSDVFNCLLPNFKNASRTTKQCNTFTFLRCFSAQKHLRNVPFLNIILTNESNFGVKSLKIEDKSPICRRARPQKVGTMVENFHFYLFVIFVAWHLRADTQLMLCLGPRRGCIPS